MPGGSVPNETVQFAALRSAFDLIKSLSQTDDIPQFQYGTTTREAYIAGFIAAKRVVRRIIKETMGAAWSPRDRFFSNEMRNATQVVIRIEVTDAHDIPRLDADLRRCFLVGYEEFLSLARDMLINCGL